MIFTEGFAQAISFELDDDETAIEEEESEDREELELDTTELDTRTLDETEDIDDLDKSDDFDELDKTDDRALDIEFCELLLLTLLAILELDDIPFPVTGIEHSFFGLVGIGLLPKVVVEQIKLPFNILKTNLSEAP